MRSSPSSIMKLMYAPPAEYGCKALQYSFAHVEIVSLFAGSGSTPTITAAHTKTPRAKLVRFNLVNLYNNCSPKCPRRPLEMGRLAQGRQKFNRKKAWLIEPGLF